MNNLSCARPRVDHDIATLEVSLPRRPHRIAVAERRAERDIIVRIQPPRPIGIGISKVPLRVGHKKVRC